MKKILIILSVFLLSSACGFEIIDRTKLANYDINEIITIGDKRINFKIKNKLLYGSKKNDKKLFTIYLNTKKTKTVKEKNIKNEITKYLININIEVKFEEINKNVSGSFSVNKSGDYNVGSQYSQTLNNEKKLTELLTDKLSEEILDELGIRLNAS